jgi:(1->4)-alpha-D-glucan 1-alpha-D-glucosylmutase
MFLRDFLPLQQRVARAGAFNSLSQLLLKLASPGVPDLYQGCELWDFSLVDPDNRRPVDYARRQAALRSIKSVHAEQGAAVCARGLLERLQDGEIKLYLSWKVLGLRREHAALFHDGDYQPLRTHGVHAERVCAFARQAGDETLVLVVPRLIGGFIGEHGLPVGAAVWGDTWVELPPEQAPAQWTCVLTGQTLATQAQGETPGLALAQVFAAFPYALLHAAREAIHEEERT